jgi:DNA modification methylase
VTRLGDLWLLGEHRLFCGDALEAESYVRVLGTEKAEMVFADAPLSLSETYALKYWWCSPPRTGIASVRPTV